MPIDWFTVVAQILNFIVLVWILRRFLYRPVLRTMDERQQRVRQSITDAAREKELANEEREKLEGERRELAQRRDADLGRVRAEAEAERVRLIDQARQEFESSRARWREALQREKSEFERDLAAEARREVIAIAGRLLRDLADADLQGQIVGKFLTLLEGLDPPERERLQTASRRAVSPSATVHSAFELPADRREAVARAVRELLGDAVAIEFETKAALGCGIELSVDGQKVVWSIDDYLRSLDACMHDLINSRTRQYDKGNKITAAAGE